MEILPTQSKKTYLFISKKKKFTCYLELNLSLSSLGLNYCDLSTCKLLWAIVFPLFTACNYLLFVYSSAHQMVLSQVFFFFFPLSIALTIATYQTRLQHTWGLHINDKFSIAGGTIYCYLIVCLFCECRCNKNDTLNSFAQYNHHLLWSALKRMTSVSKRGKKAKTVIRHFHWENPNNRNKSDDTKSKATNFSSFGSKNLQWLHIQQTEDCQKKKKKKPLRKKGKCKFSEMVIVLCLFN